jgi:hypothetical protein
MTGSTPSSVVGGVSAQRAHRGSNLAPAGACRKRWMVEEALDGTHPRVGYARSFQTLYGFLRGEVGDGGLYLGVKLRPAMHRSNPSLVGNARMAPATNRRSKTTQGDPTWCPRSESSLSPRELLRPPPIPLGHQR